MQRYLWHEIHHYILNRFNTYLIDIHYLNYYWSLNILMQSGISIFISVIFATVFLVQIRCQSTQPQEEDFTKMKEDELWTNIVKRIQNPVWISKLGVLVSVGVIVNFTMLSLIGIHFTYVLEANSIILYCIYGIIQ